MIDCSFIKRFKDVGIVVIPVLTKDEVDETRTGLHNFLISEGVNPDDLASTAHNLASLSSTGGSGGVLDVFYEDWKLKLNQNEKIFSILSQIWENTYASSIINFDNSYNRLLQNDSESDTFCHPYGNFDPKKGYMYIDRICYRVPEAVATLDNTSSVGRNETVSSLNLTSKKKRKLQRSLTPHLDCCPHNLYNSDKKNRKWKPIQAFIALSDTLEPEQGGFEACPGFHKQFHNWSLSRQGQSATSNIIGTAKNQAIATEPPCIGDFTPIRPIEDVAVIEQFRHIPCKAGDLVLWDYRIPHANSRTNSSGAPRVVVYLGFLPHVEINRLYAEFQWTRLSAGLPPNDQWHSCQDLRPCDFHFSQLGRRLLGIEPWD